MRYWSATLLIFMGGGLGIAQNNDACYDLVKSASVKLPEFFNDGKFDEIDSIVTYWELKCGPFELSKRFRVLLDLYRGNFNSSKIDYSFYQSILEYIVDEKFKILMDSVHENPRLIYLQYFSDPDLYFALNNLSQNLAKELLIKHDTSPLCSTEKILLNAYAGNFNKFSSALTDIECFEILAIYFQQQLHRIQKRLLVDAFVYTGIWMPQGANKILGNHPVLGFSFGVGRNRMIYDFAVEFRFANSKESYRVIQNGSTVETSHFFGGYIGLDLGYEFFRLRSSRFYLVSGIAADGFDTIKANKATDTEAQSIFVLNLNCGIGWRRFSQDGSFFGFEIRQNFVDYKNPGGTSLQGGTMTFRIMAGLLKNDKRHRELGYLKRVTE